MSQAYKTLVFKPLRFQRPVSVSMTSGAGNKIKSTETRRLVFECSYVYASVRYKIWHNITQRKSSPSASSFNGSECESVSGSVMSEAL